MYPPYPPSSKTPVARLKILTLDPKEADVRVVAQYNPKEVQIDQSMGWTDPPTKDRALGLEFGGKGPRTMSIELLFDGAEEARSVRRELDALEGLTHNLGTGKDAHPPRITVLWGESADDSLPRFPAVIESMSVKCQMFSADGKILRATATLKLKEAGTLGIKKAG